MKVRWRTGKFRHSAKNTADARAWKAAKVASSYAPALLAAWPRSAGVAFQGLLQKRQGLGSPTCALGRPPTWCASAPLPAWPAPICIA